MAPRESISERRYTERSGMRRHVQSVGQQRHRTGDPSGGDLDHHHRRGQRYHPTRSAFMLVVGVAEEDVVVPVV